MKDAQRTDEELMQEIVAGREEAFNELYRRYAGRIYAYGYRMLGDDETRAEDFRQQVFLQLLQGARRYDPQRPFATYLFSIAANLAKNYYRDRERARTHRATAAPPPAGREPDYFQPEEAAYSRRQLAAALQRLPPDQQLCVQLRFHEQKSIEEIARITGSPAGTVKSRLHYALKKLSRQLANPRMR